MKVEMQIEDGLKDRDDLIQIMNAAAEYLASRDRDPESTVAAVWRLYPGPQGQPLVGLGLEDAPYSTGRTYSPSQLVPQDIRNLRLLDVWGDLTRARSHREFDRVNELINQAGEG